MKRVIDISHHNVISDWKALKNDVDGVIIRLGYRGYSAGTLAYDRKYGEFRKRCIENGIPYGLYYFPCSINEKEALEEAAFILNDVPKDSPFPIFLDSEVADVKFGKGRADKLSKAERTKYLKVIIDKLAEHQVKCGVYASTSWLNTKLDMTKLQVPVWVAQYNSTCTYRGEYVAWQFTSKANIKGVRGNCDLSRWYGEAEAKNKKTIVEEKEVQAVAVGIVNVTSLLNVRSLPGTNGLVVKQLKKNETVTIFEQRGDWLAINKEKSQWVMAKYVIKTDKKATVGGIILP